MDICTCNQSNMASFDRKKKASKNSVFHWIQKRRQCDMVYPNKMLKSFVTRKLPELFQAKEFNMGTIDKIFASQWLDERHVVYGTKCNNLCILDIVSGKSSTISMIKGPTTIEEGNNCGIHSIEINPSQTLLATGGDNPNDLGIFKLPEFYPVCLGMEHTDWIFSVVWLNDYLVATGSRDGCLGVWDTRFECNIDRASDSDVLIKKPIGWLRSINQDERFRAIQYNPVSNVLASLSTKAVLHIWDANRFKTISSVDLPYPQENVCLSLEPDNTLYAVGSQSHVTMLDGRCPSKLLYSVESIDKDAGIRSLSFHNDVLTIGTGFGSCSFLDLRTNKFIQKPNGNVCRLEAGQGWLVSCTIDLNFIAILAMWLGVFSPNTRRFTDQEESASCYSTGQVLPAFTVILSNNHYSNNYPTVLSNNCYRSFALDNEILYFLLWFKQTCPKECQLFLPFQRRDEIFYTLFDAICFPTTIYTHCYDPTGSKLFTGGGPLAVGLYGNYAALWQ